MWRDKKIEHTRLITQGDPHHANGSKNYLPLWEIIKLSLDYTLNRFKVDGMGDVAEDLMRQYARLGPSSENPELLERPKKQDGQWLFPKSAPKDAGVGIGKYRYGGSTRSFNIGGPDQVV